MHITPQIQRNVATIDENSSTLDAAQEMAKRYIGSLVVTDAYGVKGIFTERDLMMRVIGEGLDPAQVKIAGAMHKTPVRIKPNEEVSRCLDLMKENRCRHLLVFEGEQFIGIVSMRDMVALMLGEKEALIARLQEFITG